MSKAAWLVGAFERSSQMLVHLSFINNQLHYQKCSGQIIELNHAINLIYSKGNNYKDRLTWIQPSSGIPCYRIIAFKWRVVRCQ